MQTIKTTQNTNYTKCKQYKLYKIQTKQTIQNTNYTN